MSILILARPLDPTADAVVQELDHRGIHVVRADMADFPKRLRLDARLSTGRWSGWARHSMNWRWKNFAPSGIATLLLPSRSQV